MFDDAIKFPEYATGLWELRQAAQGDAAKDAVKLVTNTCWGKLALDPRRYREHVVTPLGEHAGEGWRRWADIGASSVWHRPNPGDTFWAVHSAASITAAQRARMTDVLGYLGDAALYWDTDSVITTDLKGLPLSNHKQMGEWWLENVYTELYIDRAKRYAGRSDDSPWKVASSAVPMTGDEVRDLVMRTEWNCLLYTSPSPRDRTRSRMPSSA